MKQILTITFLMLISIVQGQNLLVPVNDVFPLEEGQSELFTLDATILKEVVQSNLIELEVGPLTFFGEKEQVVYPVSTASGMNFDIQVLTFNSEQGHLSYFDDGTVFMYQLQDSGAMVLSQNEDGFYTLQVDTSDRHYQCAALNHKEAVPPNSDVNTLSSKVIEVYLEGDHALFKAKGGHQGSVQWIHSVFEIVKTLYRRENINVKVSSIFLWDRPDSYSQRSSVEALQQFRSSSHTKTGDLRHLLALGPNRLGGVAWLNTLCTSYNYAYSNVESNFAAFPNYSWTVMVITHEMGHNIGSPHTQACAWGPGRQALDNCYTTEGNCPPGPAPINGGTIMSYCHLTSNGINLTNGFGTLPGDLVRSRVNSATCLSEDNPCVSPSIGLGTITETTANIQWVGTGVTTYYLRYRETSVNNWTEQATNATSYQIKGLKSGTPYTIQLRSDCEAGYTTTATFKTQNGPEGCGKFENTDFESATIMFTQSREDDFDWTRKSGRTSSSGTGPNEASQGRWYAYTESSSPNYPNQRAVLVSKCFTVGAGQKLSFDYHMYGSSIGILSILQDGRVIWSKKGDQGNKWSTATVDLKESTGSILTIEATTGQRYRSDIAIDDIKIVGADDGGDDGGEEPPKPACEADPGSSTMEWIQSITIGDQSLSTGNNGGYIKRPWDITPGTYNVIITPGFIRTPCQEVHVSIFKDFNGTWVPLTKGTTMTTYTGRMSITEGLYRFIVSHEEVSDPCAKVKWGEIEDYTIK